MASRSTFIALTGALVACGMAAAGLAHAAPAVDAGPVATDARVAGDDSQTRFIVDLTRKVELRAFTLADPYRVIIDLTQTAFQFPSKTGEKGRGLIKAFRYGVVMQGGSRIVIDVAKPVRVDKAFVLDAAQGQPARLVIELAAIDRDTFMRNLGGDNKIQRPDPARKTSRERDPQSATDPRPIIVVDPGHGGMDTGAKSSGQDNEKDIVLAFGLLLRDTLEKTGKYRVVMTRSDDTFVPLTDRVRLARERQASLFLSIHADWISKREGDATGASVYTVSDKASDAEAARLAEAENKADAIAGIDLAAEPNDVADILISLAQRETKAFSLQFASQLVSELKKNVRLHHEPMKSAGFVVLKAPDVPSVLLELGYVSNREDLKSLKSDEWRAKTVQTVTAAIDTFFRTRLAGAAATAR